MRVVALYRVSSERQEAEGSSLEAQHRRYHELAAREAWSTVAEFRGVESAAGAARERHVLQQVLAAVRAGGVDAVWVIEQSRLTRGDELEVALLIRELRERQIAVWVDATRRDLTDPSDGLAFGIVSLVDRAEIERFRERTRRGRREKALQGKRTGGAAPYGYRNPPKGSPQHGTLQPVEGEAAVVRRIYALAAGGEGQRRIAERLNAEGIPSSRGGRWCKSAVRMVLSNPAYRGAVVSGAWHRERDAGSFRFDPGRPGAIVVEGAHEPLVDPAVCAAARAHRGATSAGRPGLLTGMLWVDGRRAVIDRSHGAHFYRPREGRGPWVRVDAVNALVWCALGEILAHPAAVAALLERGADAQDPASEIEALERRRGKLLARCARLVAMRADGEIDRQTFAEQTAAAQSQVRTLEAEVRSARRRMDARRSGNVEAAIAAAAAVVRQPLTTVMQRRIVRSLVERVDASLRPNPQPRGESGRLLPGAKWSVDDLYLHLRRGPDVGTTGADSDRSLVTVQVVRAGRVLSFAEASRFSAARPAGGAA